MKNCWLLYFKYDGRWHYYAGDNGDGAALWTPDPTRAVLLEDMKALKIADAHDAYRAYVDPEFHCNHCGSHHVCSSPCGDLLCAGCGHGAHGLICQPRDPIQNCSQCGAPIYSAELFRGPVCSKCGHWC